LAKAGLDKNIEPIRVSLRTTPMDAGEVVLAQEE
jgi:hypothetical protein